MESGQECENHINYATALCPSTHKAIGDFLCEYKCPEGFKDSGAYCEPEIMERHEYFMSDFSGKVNVLPE